jgi:hypothetical protein
VKGNVFFWAIAGKIFEFFYYIIQIVKEIPEHKILKK